MNRQRLEHAITVMERVRDEKMPFDMERWFATLGDSTDCGTAACFWGWCARDEKFRAAGVSIVDKHIKFLRKPGALGCAAFFEIDYFAATFLTQPDEYADPKNVTPDDVIAHIRHLLDHDGCVL